MLSIASTAYSITSSARARKKMRAMLDSLKNSGQTITVQEAAGSRHIVYGTARKGGNRVFAHLTGTKGEYLHVIIALALGECESIGDIYLGDDVVPLDASGNATGTYSGFVRCKKYTGTTTQVIGSSTLAVEAPGIWDASHKGSGIAAIELRFKYDSDKYPNGIENISAMVSGRKLYDPRTGATAFSNNPALVVRDYLTNPQYGFGAAEDEIDDATVIAAANVCDEDVGLVGGGTEKRYTCNGVVDTSNIRSEILLQLTNSMAGWVVYSGGRWRVYAGAHRAPSASFTLDDLRGPITVQASASRRDSCNGVKGVFLCQDNQWQPADYPPIRNATYEVEDATQVRSVTADATTDALTLDAQTNILAGTAIRLSTTGTAPGGITAGTVYYAIVVDSTHIKVASTRANATAGTSIDITSAGTGAHSILVGDTVWREMDLPFTTSAATAQRLAKIELERSRQDIVVSLPLKLHGMRVQAGDVFALTVARYGWTNKLFEVSEWKFSLDDGDNPALGVDIVACETAAGVWDWADGEETAIDLAPNTTLPDPRNVATPAGLTVTSGATTVQMQPDGTVLPRMLVAWTAPNDIHIESGGRVIIETAINGSGAWFPAKTVRGDATSDYLVGYRAGGVFDIRVRFQNNRGIRGEWATVTGHTLVGDTAKPSAPGTPTAVAYPGYNRITWSKSSAADVYEYAIYRNTSNSFSGATKLGETGGLAWDDPSVTAGVTYYYFVTAIDGSENESDPTSSGAATTATAPVGAVVPSAPSAASRVTPGSNDTYMAGDGTVYAFITLSVPAMPSGAVWQNVLYRRNGGGEWIVAAQLKNTGSTTLRVDDLSTGVAYEFATQAWSGAGGSAITAATGSPFTAPTKTGAPPVMSSTYGFGLLNYGFSPTFTSSGARRYGVAARWADGIGYTNYPYPSDFSHWEVKATATDSDAAVDYNADSGSGVPALIKSSSPVVFYYVDSPVRSYLRIRGVNKSGQAADWFRATTIWETPGYWTLTGGDASAKNVGTTSGTVAAGDDSRITGAAQKASNLSDLTNTSAARSNLGVGTAATLNADNMGAVGLSSITSTNGDGYGPAMRSAVGSNYMSFKWGSTLLIKIDVSEFIIPHHAGKSSAVGFVSGGGVSDAQDVEARAALDSVIQTLKDWNIMA
ncbi:hypothetical protein [Opitutus sp. ER46]|uniref:hypothetical protein n=1 Tax=Opitutus sp. ER46 TaxID=2161864 RepID=UPI001E3EEC56|nr:hypothetical protein [Opitutus sp. ER46]